MFGIIGGGAAGIFTAITLKRLRPDCRVVVLEKTRQLLSKVKISGGGRCNVTHGCFDIKKLSSNYPRGMKELIGPFARFQPKDMIAWFLDRGVELKVEEDGRMFPISNSSQTIIDCFLEEAKTLGVEILLEQQITGIEPQGNQWMVHVQNHPPMVFRALVLATGSQKEPLKWLEALGQQVKAQVPSLFTFNIPDSPLVELSGVSVEDVIVTLPESSLSTRGPVLITHWGFSGPAVLRLSAFAARELFKMDYKSKVEIDWMPQIKMGDLLGFFKDCKTTFPSKAIVSETVSIPKSLWKKICILSGIHIDQRWAEISNAGIEKLAILCKKYTCQINGKTTYKQEFVTAGGVGLQGVDFTRMESRSLPNVFFAGEVLDIDGVTGGFNFQAAWTTSWIAAHSLALL